MDHQKKTVEYASESLKELSEGILKKFYIF